MSTTAAAVLKMKTPTETDKTKRKMKEQEKKIDEVKWLHFLLLLSGAVKVRYLYQSKVL